MTPTWFAHPDLMNVFIGVLCLVVAFFFTRTLKKIDANQTSLFNKLEKHEKRLSFLEGAHETRTGMKISCGVDK